MASAQEIQPPVVIDLVPPGGDPITIDIVPPGGSPQTIDVNPYNPNYSSGSSGGGSSANSSSQETPEPVVIRTLEEVQMYVFSPESTVEERRVTILTRILELYQMLLELVKAENQA